jgi:Terpene synthase family 2, C-terminal metal binding
VKDGGPGCTERFIHTMDLFFKAVAQQSADRAQGWIPDLESYVPLRRDTSGCKPCFALIEYAAGIDLPDYVVEHPTIRALEEATNDLVTWSNVYPSPVSLLGVLYTLIQDIFSYSVERSRYDTHNMIPIMMFHQNFTLQEAVDFVGDLCKSSIERFEADRVSIPSWGPDIDRDVATYVDGLQNWIVGMCAVWCLLGQEGKTN